MMDERETASAERLKEHRAVEVLQGMASESWSAEPHDVVLVKPEVARAWIKAGVAQEPPERKEPPQKREPRTATAPPKRDATAVRTTRG